MDWGKAKRYYVTHPDASYADISAKFGISMRQVCRHSKEENWRESRKKYVAKTTEKSIEKMSETESDRAAKRKEDYMSLAQLTLEKVLSAIQICEPEDRDGLRKMVASVKDLQQILMINPDEDTGSSEVTVTIMSEKPSADDWGN